MTTVTASEMQDKLLTLDQVKEQLAKTEPLEATIVSTDTKTRFHLSEDWAEGLDSAQGTSLVNATVSIDGKESRLSKDAILQAASAFGLQKAYVRKTPARLIEEHLNYWYSGGIGDNVFTSLAVQGSVQAFAKATLTPFSNLQLLENVESSIRRKYGQDAEIFGDYKFRNDITQTNMRLIIPEESRTIQNTGTEDDRWSAGVHVSNSLTGKSQTSIEAYLFRWWCTNGCTTEFDDVGSWNRRLNGQDETDVWEWARTSVDDVLGGLENRFQEVQNLTELDVTGNIVDVTREVFENYRIPVAQRQGVLDSLAQANVLTMYTIMQAVTQTANDPDLSDDRRDRMMRIGGKIPTAQFDPLKARVFREGQTNPQGPNPYEIPSAV